MARKTRTPARQHSEIDLAAEERRRADAPSRPREAGRGRHAEHPGEMPKEGWKDVLVRVKGEVKKDRVTLAAAGVAFYGMLALFPALTALISIYGLVADPAQVQQQIQSLTSGLGGEAGQLINEQAQTIASTESAALSVGFAVALLLALWSASTGMHGLMQALTLAYNEDETRGFLKRRAIAIALTLVAILLVAFAAAAIVVVPLLLGGLGLGTVGEWAVRILRWPLVALVFVVALAVIYRFAPNRDKPQWTWVTPGAVLATVLWILGSIGFSIYVQNLGNYNETYGALGSVIVLLLWLFLSAFIVLLGAELNSELEHQTAVDTTAGHPEPMGQRGAHVADHLAPSRPARE